jgi:mono/diheme cytochrome c family protein
MIPLLSTLSASAAQSVESEVSLSLPRGRTAEGRQVFLDLRCVACHRVDGDEDLPSPVSASPGPDLGARQAARGAGYLATSIVTPSHEISIDPDDEILHDVAGLTSPMGDYSRAMTVLQLVDLLAYLTSLEQ